MLLKKKKLKMNMISKLKSDIANMIEKEIKGKTPFIDDYGFEIQNKETIELKKKIQLLNNIKKNISVQNIKEKKDNNYEEKDKIKKKIKKTNIYEKRQSRNFSQQEQEKRKKFRIKITECLKKEINKFIDNEISEARNNFYKNIEPIKKTFFRLFYSKLSKIISVIILGDDYKFFKLLRKEYDKKISDKFNTFYNSFLFYNRNINKVNEIIIYSFIKSILNINCIKGQMIFLITQYYNMDQNIQRIISLQDSIFYNSEQMRKELDFQTKETTLGKNIFSEKII